MSKRRPPPKTKEACEKGQYKGPRRFDGAMMLDVATATLELGGTEKGTYSKVKRGLLPHRRLGGRIVFLRSDLHAFLRQLPGVTVDQALENIAIRNGEAQA